jgi:hypothetical protein
VQSSVGEQLRAGAPADVHRAARGQRVTFTFPTDEPGEREIVVHATLGKQVKFSYCFRQLSG